MHIFHGFSAAFYQKAMEYEKDKEMDNDS